MIFNNEFIELFLRNNSQNKKPEQEKQELSTLCSVNTTNLVRYPLMVLDPNARYELSCEVYSINKLQLAATLEFASHEDIAEDKYHMGLLTYDTKLQKELKDYYVLYLDREYDEYIKDNLGVVARNLIPDIIRIRRKLCRDFKMRLFNALYSNTYPLINFSFVSVDENDEYDDKVIFDRTDIGGFRIILK